MHENPFQDNQVGAKEAQQQKHRTWVKRLWQLLTLGVVIGVLWFIGLILFGDLPSFDILENPKISDASQIISSDGDELGRFYRENRVRVRYEEISPYVVDALVATEDERYYKHAGIDRQALQRVLVKSLLLQNTSAGGGSTITQQLAKLLFKRPNLRNKNAVAKVWYMLNIKLKEWITAVKLERRYTKSEIMTMYLNQFDFLYGAYGIKSASKIYFDTEPDSLKMEEAAMLVGMLKNPSLYNPIRYADQASKRREVVLKQMVKNGKLTQTEYDSLRVLPLDLSRFKRVDHNEGLAPHFREHLRQEVKEILAKEEKPGGGHYDIYTDGLRIYTTIDARMQQHAEEAAAKHLKDLQETFFKHWKDKDPWTHGVKEGSSSYEARQNGFERLVRESDRYSKLRPKWLKKTKELKIRDVDYSRMKRIERDGWDVMDEWLETGFINKKLAKLYQNVMGKNKNSDDWKMVKMEYAALNKEADKVFNKPVKMRVFTYDNDRFEKDTVMTPYDSIRYQRMILQVGMMAVNPETGHIKAWVGGMNHKYFKYDHVNAANKRQVGSTFKPFLYALSVQRGYSPCYKVLDGPVVIEAGEGRFGTMRNWRPKNADGRYTNNWLTLQDGLRYSKNTVSAQLMKDLGSTVPLRDLTERLGIPKSKVPASPAIALGAADLSVFEMTGAYTAFVNQGIYTKPIFIERIEDRNGNVIYKPETEQRQVFEPHVYNAMVSMLKGVMTNRPGFGGTRSEIGGKTGTTNKHADGWFMGLTPNIVVGTWVGGDDRWVRFRTIRYGQGARMARPIFANFLKAIEKDKDINFDAERRFTRIENPNNLEMDCTKYSNMPEGIDEEEYTINEDGVIINEGDSDDVFNEF